MFVVNDALDLVSMLWTDNIGQAVLSQQIPAEQ